MFLISHLPYYWLSECWIKTAQVWVTQIQYFSQKIIFQAKNGIQSSRGTLQRRLKSLPEKFLAEQVLFRRETLMLSFSECQEQLPLWMRITLTSSNWRLAHNDHTGALFPCVPAERSSSWILEQKRLFHSNSCYSVSLWQM